MQKGESQKQSCPSNVQGAEDLCFAALSLTSRPQLQSAVSFVLALYYCGEKSFVYRWGSIAVRAAHRKMGIFPLCYLIVFPFTGYGWHFVVVMMKERLETEEKVRLKKEKEKKTNREK